MKKRMLFLGALVAMVAMAISFQTESTWASAKLYNSKGCGGCHNAYKGMDPRKPSKKHMASISLAEFTDCVKNGRPGTMMTAQKGLSDADIKSIYDWLKSSN